MIPETIYIEPSEGSEGDGEYSGITFFEASDDPLFVSSLPYDRRKPPCVWRWSDRAKAWFTGCHRTEQEKEATANWCRYCGGRIEIAEEE